MGEPNLSGFSLPDTYDPTKAAPAGQPKIVKFCAADGKKSVQLEQGQPVTLVWSISGKPDSLVLDGAPTPPAATATSMSVTPTKDTDYTLRVKSAAGEDTATVHVALHAPREPASPHLPLKKAAAGSGVESDGKSIMVAPPVRLLAQYDPRWGKIHVGGAINTKTNSWQNDGCSATSAAMILRWFAEDRGLCKYPSKPESQIPEDHYGQRLGEAFWPDGFQYYSKVTGVKEPAGNPDGRVGLTASGVDFPDIFDYAAYWLRHGTIPPGKSEKERVSVAHGLAYTQNGKPKEGWIPLIKKLLEYGPCIIGIGQPGGHFMVCQGIRADGAMLVVDPGAVVNTAIALGGEGKVIANWKGKQKFEPGQRMPPRTQWPKGVQGREYDEVCYFAISGQALTEMLDGLLHVHSLTFPDVKPESKVTPEADETPAAEAAPEAQAEPDPPSLQAQEAQPDKPAGTAAAPGACDKCDQLEKLIGNGVAQKIKKGSKDTACVSLLQFHLVQFGHSLGTSGPNGDGVDGDYGNLTAKALKAFFDSAGSSEGTDALSDAGAKLIVKKHKDGGTDAPRDPPAQAQQQAAAGPVSSELEVFFKYHGWIGPTYYGKANYSKNKKYDYVAYRVKDKDAWFLRGRGMVDFDGAPNAYHPDGSGMKPITVGMYPTYDVMKLDRPLETLDNGPSGMQKGPDGKEYYVQSASDPAPGYYVMATPLVRGEVKERWNPRRYADARVTPYFACPQQLLNLKKIASTVWDGFELVGDGKKCNFGDYVTAVNLKPKNYAGEKSWEAPHIKTVTINGKKLPYAHALIGDTGNKPHVGECSYALARRIHTLSGIEWADVLWIFHPGSGKGQFVIPETDAIESRGEDLFNAWGGEKQLETVLGLPELANNGS